MGTWDSRWLVCDTTACPAVMQDETGMLAKRFEFDRVFQPSSTQVEVFAEV